MACQPDVPSLWGINGIIITPLGIAIERPCKRGERSARLNLGQIYIICLFTNTAVIFYVHMW